MDAAEVEKPLASKFESIDWVDNWNYCSQYQNVIFEKDCAIHCEADNSVL